MSGGLYVLLTCVARRAEISVAGRSHRLTPGWYAYTGSARRGLDARVARHLAADKRVHWHIDHLTTHPAAKPVGALLFEQTRTPHGGETGPAASAAECWLNQMVGLIVGGDAPIRGFGAGDCESRCAAHLWRCDRRFTLAALAGELVVAGLGRPTIVRNPRVSSCRRP